MRNAAYAEQYDWDTLFYDVYRVGKDIVFQGPPYFNLLEPLKRSSGLRGRFRWPWPEAKHVGRDKRGDGTARG